MELPGFCLVTPIDGMVLTGADGRVADGVMTTGLIASASVFSQVARLLA